MKLKDLLPAWWTGEGINKKGLYGNPNPVFSDPKGQIIWLTDDPGTAIRDGYDKNSVLYAITNYASKKFAQISFRLYKVNKGREKELDLYRYQSKRTRDPLNLKTLALRRKALDEAIVENELDQLLQQPNRHQGQDSFLEQLYGYRNLTGEGNLWLNTGIDPDGKPEELLIIPKSNLLLVSDPNDPWGILSYEIQLGADRMAVQKQNILMWKRPGYDFDAQTKIHLRGQSPMKSLLLTLQALNAGERRSVALNENAGVSGALFDETERQVPLSQEQLDQLRYKMNQITNGTANVGKVVMIGGKYKYQQFGMNAVELDLLERSKIDARKMMAGFGMPAEIFEPDATHTNKKEAKRGWIYDTLVPDAYSLRDEMNRVLLKKFRLSSDQWFIDCDISSLPEMSTDLKETVEALKNAHWLKPNEQRVGTGYEADETDPNMDKYYFPSGLVPLDQLNAEIGAPLDDEENIVNPKY